MADRKLSAHRERQWTLANSGNLPTPHGRALAPWREFVPVSTNPTEAENSLPARDRKGA